MKNRFIKIITILTAVTAMTACSKNNTSNLFDNSRDPSSSFAPIAIKTNAVKELRNPDTLNQDYPSKLFSNEQFVAFRNKIQAFSNRLSEVILKREYAQDENIALSPLSIELCLGLAIRSANGNTRKELLDLMDMDFETFDTWYKYYYDMLYSDITNNSNEIMSQLLLDNSVWVSSAANPKDDCLDALRDNYYCHSFSADFQKQNKASNKALSDYAYNKTKGLIKHDFDLSKDTLFVLMNTLYLKDIWNEAGANLPYASSDYHFKNADGVTSNKKLLEGYYVVGKAINTDDYSCFYTRTTNHRIYFVKPHENKSLTGTFTKETMDYVLDNSNYETYYDEANNVKYRTRCIFPEFEAKGDFDLLKVFQENLDCHLIFSNAADLSNLSEDSIKCTSFRQVAVLKVNKEGTEGAAITYMGMEPTSVQVPIVTYVDETFLVDQECGYILTDNNNNVIFTGTISNID